MCNIDKVHDSMLNAISDNYQKTEGFATYDLTRGMAYAALELWEKAKQIEREQDVRNLTGDKLTKFVFQRKGVERKGATKAKGLLTVTDGAGHITAGDLFASDGGLIFKALEDKDVLLNDTFLVECATAGSIGNVGAETINKMLTKIEGVKAITNKSLFAGGYEEETDDDVRERYFTELKYPATSGNIYHYRKWALEVAGVGNAKAIGLWNGDNTVKVIIINSDRKGADSSLVANVQKYIDPNKGGRGEGVAPVGAHCTVVSAKEKKINITAKVKLKSHADIEEVKREFTTSCEEYFKRIAFTQDVVSYAHVGAALINVKGVADYNALELNNSASSVPIGEEEVGVLGTVTLNEQA